MARYVDVDKLLEELQEEIDYETSMYTKEENKWFKIGLKCAYRDVEHQSIADVVPVVRCKDCKNAITVKDDDFLQDYVWCYYHGDRFISKENYCSFAIRRDNNE